MNNEKYLLTGLS